MTRAGLGRTKVKVVVRRFFDPVVPIHGREELKWLTRAEPAEPTFGPELELEDDPTKPPADELVACDACETAEAAGAEAAAGTTGSGKAGATGSGTDGAGSETVTVGTGGMGIGSPAAVPATSPAPTRTASAASAFISKQLATAAIGCGPSGRGHRIPKVAVLKRDYYEVLGVSSDADDEAIRRAFHALARDWHPDVAEAPDAEERFRELAEAYSALSKRETRLLYDRYGYRGRGNQGFDEALWEARPPEVVRGENIRTAIELRSFEADEGTRRLLSFDAVVRCTACMGRGTAGLPDPECEYCHGSGKQASALHAYFPDVREFGPCPVCVSEPCARCGGTGTVPAVRRIRLLIPPGVEDGAQLRVSGDGNDAGAGSVPGDLLVRVHVLPAPSDPRAVRYLAFVLLLVAIATLLVYVLR